MWFCNDQFDVNLRIKSIDLICFISYFNRIHEYTLQNIIRNDIKYYIEHERPHSVYSFKL